MMPHAVDHVDSIGPGVGEVQQPPTSAVVVDVGVVEARRVTGNERDEAGSDERHTAPRPAATSFRHQA